MSATGRVRALLGGALVATALGANGQQEPDAIPELMVPLPPSGDVGMVQEAWRTGQTRKGQQHAGYRVCHFQHGRSCPVFVRTGTITTVVLDASEEIETIAVGDPALLTATEETNRRNAVHLRANVVGADTNVTLIGSSGRIYTFWVTTEDETQAKTPDVRVDVRLPSAHRWGHRAGTRGTGTARAWSPDGGADGAEATGGDGEQWRRDLKSAQARDRTMLATLGAGAQVLPREILEEYGNLQVDNFQVGRLKFDLTVWTPDDGGASAQVLGPCRVMHDGVWTWIDYECTPDARIGSVMLVTDGTETPVDTSMEGPGNRFLVVKAVGDLVIKSGPHILCIKRTKPKIYHAGFDRGIAPLDPGWTGRGTPPVPDTGRAPAAVSGPPLRAVSIDIATEDDRARARLAVERHAPLHAEQVPELRGVEWRQASALCEALGRQNVGCTITQGR